MSHLTFTVRGIPAPQGSKRAFRNKYSGRIQQVESSTRVKPWRSDVRDAAFAAIGGTVAVHPGVTIENWEPMTGPLEVALMFRLPRPKGHFGTGRNAAQLKPAAPAWPSSKPDLDKLIRAVLDACTSIVWVDDAQVVCLVVDKRYAEAGQQPGLDIDVEQLNISRGTAAAS